MMNNAVECDRLVVRRGHTTAVAGLSLSIPVGPIVGLLGPSGCGKTTLMRSIVGVQQITSGSVTTLGYRAGSARLRSRIGYMTQQPSVYADLTVAQNLRYFARVHGLPRRALVAEVDRILEHTGLTPHAGRLVHTLSGGQASRVSLAVAMLGSPELLVLDEPTVGLDPVLRGELWQLFRELADGGTTLVISSHVMDEAGRCDRLLLMREGRLVADTTPRELLVSTGQADAEAAFVAMITRHEAQVPISGTPHRHRAGDRSDTEARR